MVDSLFLFWLVVWNIFYFSISWECHHPNWLSYFQRGRSTTNQFYVWPMFNSNGQFGVLLLLDKAISAMVFCDCLTSVVNGIYRFGKCQHWHEHPIFFSHPTGWGPPVISGFINHEITPINYSYTYHKATEIRQLSYLGGPILYHPLNIGWTVQWDEPGYQLHDQGASLPGCHDPMP